jgi:hypothetical protein
MKQQTITSLAHILKGCNLFLKGVSWKNVATLGDENIQSLIDSVNSYYSYFLSRTKDVNGNNLLIASEKKLYEEQLRSFVNAVDQRKSAIIQMLQNEMTGVRKPLLPLLREAKTYLGVHLVAFPYNNVHVNPKTWRSMLATSSSNGSGNERYHLNPFTPLVNVEDKIAIREFSACGYYWQVEIKSSTVMTYDDLVFFKKGEDQAFTELWFANSGDRDLRRIKDFYSILEKPAQFNSGFNFKREVPMLVSFLKNHVSSPEDGVRDVRRIAEAIEHDFTGK